VLRRGWKPKIWREEWGVGGRGSTPYIGRLLPQWATTPEILPPWATTLGILPLVATAAGAWPHRPVLPTVVVSPNAVPHGGRTSAAVGHRARCTFLEILIRPFISRKSWQNTYKKFTVHYYYALANWNPFSLERRDRGLPLRMAAVCRLRACRPSTLLVRAARTFQIPFLHNKQPVQNDKTTCILFYRY
jgi:hypothetical protein